MMKELTVMLVTLAALCKSFVVSDDRRPFYNIAHMVNSIPEVDFYLKKGANAIETDVSFSNDGLAKTTYHGVPCDCFRRCMLRSNFVEFLKYVREVTKDGKKSIAMLMLDLKVQELGKTTQIYAGVDLFTKLVDHLWYQVNETNRIHVLISIPRAEDRNVFKGLLGELNNAEYSMYRNRVGFDVGLNSQLAEISSMYDALGITENIWQGDGITNCFVGMRPDSRLREAIDLRDATKGYVTKVYHWTIDLTSALENSLHSGVDGIITNHPERINSLIKYAYAARYRMANQTDSPWEKIMKISKSGNIIGSRSAIFDVIVNLMELSQQAMGYFSRLLGHYRR
ncbi:sphingomyelin phosphodiesterase-like [Tropilaelaps mercedesae]|uniref:Sphingomyelin phosphodiesterase-like n=1 Tax=Tropilaelaps mercedesae TaxID=418985 RepID=A0A1V9XKG9_9ACAR|nr:sphingomyelin phosphodiesterase-like [Tropilaelaps mercedesae]